MNRNWRGYTNSQFFTTKPGTASRSLSVVTTTQFPRDKATAANMISTVCIGRPLRRNSAATTPNISAARRSKGQHLIPSNVLRSRAVFSSRLALNCSPKNNSAMTGSHVPIRAPLRRASITCRENGARPRIRAVTALESKRYRVNSSPSRVSPRNRQNWPFPFPDECSARLPVSHVPFR